MKLHLPTGLRAALIAVLAVAAFTTQAANPPGYSGLVITWNNSTSGNDLAHGKYLITTYDATSGTFTEGEERTGWGGGNGAGGLLISKNTTDDRNTLRFAASTYGQTDKTPVFTFAPLVLAGIIVDSGATGCSISAAGNTGSNRTFYLGNNNNTAAYSSINEDFSFNNTQHPEKVYLRGMQTIDIAADKTFTLQSHNGIDLSGNLTTTGSGTLNLAGGDVLVSTTTTLTYGSTVNIGGKLSVGVGTLTTDSSPLLTLTGTGTLNIANFEITGASMLENGTYSIVSASNDVATTLMGYWTDTEELKLVNDNGTLKLTVASTGGPIEITTNTDLLYTSETTRGYHISGGATLGINNGNGGKGGASADSSYNYGPITVEGEGSKLSVWNWTNSVQTLNTTDKVSIASPITVKDGGTIFMEDGSYYFAGGVNVDGSGSIQMQWAKGALLDCLNSEEGTTDNEFTFTAIGKDPDDRLQLYGILKDGNFNGTVNLNPQDAGPLHFAIGSENALQNAVLNLGDGTRTNIVALNTAATNMKGIQGKGSIILATGLTGNAGITESTLTLTDTDSTFSGTVGEGVTLAVAKGADLTLSGTLGLYKPFDVSGTLTLSPDLVIDLANLSYEEKEGTHVYTLATLAKDATYTGYKALSKASVKGVTAEDVTFKDDGTIVLTTAAPHAIDWDPNWGVTGPKVLSAELTADTALFTSVYKTGDDVTVELTGTGNEGAYIYGVQNSDKDQTGGTFTTNVWINAKEGSYKAIVGGSYCNNWNGGGALNLQGDTHIQVDGATVGSIVGGNLKDGKSPTFVGNSYISVIRGDVTATIIGSSTNSHSANPVHTGNTNIFIYVPLATESSNALSANQAPHLGDYVIGGGAHVDNGAGGTNKIVGSTNVTIDLSKYAGERTSFVKSVVGGHFSENSSHGQTITGSTNVTIKGGSIQFTRDIIGGSYFNSNSNSSTIDGGVSLSIEGGIYSGNVIGGTKVTNSAGSTVGAVEVSLSGTAQISGNVYAAGTIDTAGTGASTVASTTVNLGADVSLGGTLSGGFGGANADRGKVTDSKVLNLTEAKEYTHLSTVTVDMFTEISVVKDASATIKSLTNSPVLTKSGEGALTLTLGEESSIFVLEVAKGTLTLGAASMDITGITVDSGATLAAAAGSSLKTEDMPNAVTLCGGSSLSVSGEGLVMQNGAYFTLFRESDNERVAFTTTGPLGQEVILATGLTEEDSVDGITFDKVDKAGNKYANSADYLTLGTGLEDYTQLKLKDGKLILTKAAGEGSYWGKDKGPGEWNLESPDWADDDNQAPTRAFTDSNAAHFTAAGRGGAIDVTTAINVTTIYVSGAAYNFTGGQNLKITNGISVTDSGSAAFDRVAGELKNVYIAGTASKLTIKNGDVIVNALSNEGEFITSGNLTVKNATAMGGNVTASSLILTGENTFGTVKVSDTVSGATSIKLGGESRITKLSGVNKLTLTDGKLTLGSTVTELKETTLSGALETVADVGLGSLTMNDGSSITGHGAVSASGITVSGTANILGTSTMLQTASVGGTGTLKVNSGNTVSIASGSTTTVSATLDMQEGSTLANEGTLAVSNTGRVIAGDGVALGTVSADGTIEVNGAVTATGGSIAALDMGSGESLTVSAPLTLTSTTGGNDGSLNVGGALTVGGVATIGNVTAGSLELTTAGTLTTSGTLNAGIITLDRVSKTEHYLTADGLSEGTTNFWVDEDQIAALNLSAGQFITLANLNSDHAGAANLTINGAKYITDTHDLGYYISQDSDTKNIILTVRNQESDYVWTGAVDEHWDVDGNWSGGKVPDETSWVQFNGGEQSILLDGDTTTRRLTVSAGTDDTLYGDHALVLTQSLEVDANGCLHVGDGSTETMVSAPSVQIAGELNVQENAFVDSEQIAIKGGVLSVEDGGSAFTGQIDMTEGGSLYTYGEASVATGQLNGDLDSTVGGNVTVYGNGGRYTGGYDDAHIEVIEDADATFYAGEGLNLHGDGTAKLQYSGDTAIGGVDAGDLDIILNDPTSSNIGSTLTLQNPSAMEAGSITFGMSAIDSASTINTNRIPVIIDATDFAVGNETTVVVNQDKTQDTGIAMAVGNNGKTRNLVLARVGADNTNTDSVVLNGNLYGKYFKNARIEHGALLVDMNDTYYQTISGATSFNGRAGAGMLDDAFVEDNPQISNPTGDLAAVMTALEQGAISSQQADRVLSAMSGASHAAMGAAWSRDVDRQLRAIRNRTTSMGVAECVVNEDMPFINVWINAEGDYTKLNNDGTLAGYKLSSWGGTVGVDVDFTNRFTMGLAVTAMSGDFTACSADNAEGDLDRLYVSVFGRYTHRAWTHTLVGTFGMADTDLKRTVDYGVGSYTTNSSSDGTAFGLMYEVGYTVALNENATTCLQPVLNLSYRHSSLDGCSETGTDAALRGGDVDMDVFTIALGARLQSVVGTSVYNRSSIFEGRVLCKLDTGDREASTHNSFVNVGNKREVRSSEMGAFGLELGAGLVVPIAEDGGSIFFDVSAEIRDKYTEVNGTVGYRYNF